VKRILIAGIGNIFLGDDAFGVEVVRELPHHILPNEVRVMDFGIRGYDLAYALADDYDAAILVDATPRGESPGTLYLIEPDLANLGELDHASVDAHSLGPVRVLQMAQALGGHPDRLYLIGCEPGELHLEEGHMGLSDAVQAAVPKAVEMIQSLVHDLLNLEKTNVGTGVVPA
jgi:hydrogenase maturation protease